MSVINVSSPIFDMVYPIQAWEDNNRTLKLVQGEGVTIPDNATASTTIQASRAKAPRFQLKSKQGAIDLSSDNPIITWAVQRPNNGGEDLLTCNIVSGKAAEGIIEIPITTSVTEFAGDAYGEIRVTTDNTVIKFFGINACIGDGVSDDAASRSSRYEALLDVLQQVVALKNNSGGITINIPEGEEIPENIVVSLIAQMATLDDNGNLKTGASGSDPISSDTLNTYLQNKYIDYLQGKFPSFQYAHDVHSSSYTEENPVDTYDDGGVFIDDAIDRKKVYLIKNSANTEYAVMLCVTVPGALYAYGAMQFRMTHYGGISYRVSTISNGAHSWGSWINIESKNNMDTAGSTTSEISNSDSHYPSSKLVRAKLADKVDKTTTIAGHNLSNNISAEDILSALMNTGKSIYYHVGSTNPFSGEKYIDVPVPAIWKHNNNIYLVLSRTAGTPSQTYGVPYTYNGFTLPRYTYLNSWDAFDPSTTSGAYGEIVTGSTSNGVWICKGGTNWVQLAKLSDLSDIKAKTATVTLDSASWLNGSQVIDVDSVYTVTSNTKVDIDVDSDTFVALQGAGCYGIYIETSTDSNVTTLIAKTVGATPNTDITIQLIFSETTDLGVIGGGDNE